MPSEPLDLLERLVNIPSVTGNETEAVRFLREQGRLDGFRVLDDPAGNLVLETGKGPTTVWYVGHIDTVPGNLPVRRHNGTLWGRGTVDAKGPLVAAYHAALAFQGSQDLTVRVIGCIDEEGESRGVRALPTDEHPHAIIVGEPSGSHAITLGYKGIIRARLKVTRPPHHNAHPGPTAPEELYTIWNQMLVAHDVGDHFDTLQAHIVHVETRNDGARSRATAQVDIRVPPNVPIDGLVDQLRDQAAAHDARFQPFWTDAGAQADRRNPLVASFLAAIRSRGGRPHMKLKTGSSDFGYLARTHPGVPILAYGPGDASLDHTPDEHITQAELDEGVGVLGEALWSMVRAGALATAQ